MAQKAPSRQIPGIISYMDFFSSKRLAYSLFLVIPILVGTISFILNSIFTGIWNFYFFFFVIFIFLTISGIGVLATIFYYSKRAPILRMPPNGWALQLNSFLGGIIGICYIIGEVVAIFLNNVTFVEMFFILGTVISYIIGYVIYYSFTTVGRYGIFILALIQPVIGIILYSILAAQVSLIFFLRAIIFFISCAVIFVIPYAREMSTVSKIYKKVAGIGGYPFIRAFILSMMTRDNDNLIESYFEKIGIESKVKIQYIAIRSIKSKKLKGLFIIPDIHFGPFKTCGSSDLPSRIYNSFNNIPGITVYHTTNDHSRNLTTHEELEKILIKINGDIKIIENNENINWVKGIKSLSRKMQNSAKLIGTEIGDIPIMFLTRHPLPSDDMQPDIGDQIREIALSLGYHEVIIIDSHNSIIGDELLIKKDSIEGKDLINVSKNFLSSLKKTQNTDISPIKYGVAKDALEEYSERDGIGSGGLVVHLFKNTITDQKTIIVHFDANNAYVNIRSFILNMLQNRGIEYGEVTTSDSHTVARQFTSRGYSPIGEKIKLDFILQKLEELIPKAEKSLTNVELSYYSSEIDNVKIWGDPKYFDTIMDTLQECIRVSQKLLTYSLILPTFFSLLILVFYYNITFGDIF
ncbi:MAG: DUF2070 family protein [Candidatus Hodarchaeota archaeon]